MITSRTVAFVMLFTERIGVVSAFGSVVFSGISVVVVASVTTVVSTGVSGVSFPFPAKMIISKPMRRTAIIPITIKRTLLSDPIFSFDAGFGSSF